MKKGRKVRKLHRVAGNPLGMSICWSWADRMFYVLAAIYIYPNCKFSQEFQNLGEESVPVYHTLIYIIYVYIQSASLLR